MDGAAPQAELGHDVSLNTQHTGDSLRVFTDGLYCVLEEAPPENHKEIIGKALFALPNYEDVLYQILLCRASRSHSAREIGDRTESTRQSILNLAGQLALLNRKDAGEISELPQSSDETSAMSFLERVLVKVFADGKNDPIVNAFLHVEEKKIQTAKKGAQERKFLSDDDLKVSERFTMTVDGYRAEMIPDIADYERPALIQVDGRLEEVPLPAFNRFLFTQMASKFGWYEAYLTLYLSEKGRHGLLRKPDGSIAALALLHGVENIDYWLIRSQFAKNEHIWKKGQNIRDFFQGNRDLLPEADFNLLASDGAPQKDKVMSIVNFLDPLDVNGKRKGKVGEFIRLIISDLSIENLFMAFRGMIELDYQNGRIFSFGMAEGVSALVLRVSQALIDRPCILTIAEAEIKGKYASPISTYQFGFFYPALIDGITRIVPATIADGVRLLQKNPNISDTILKEKLTSIQKT